MPVIPYFKELIEWQSINESRFCSWYMCNKLGKDRPRTWGNAGLGDRLDRRRPIRLLNYNIHNPRAFDALKACLLSAPILWFPTEEDRFVLDTDASLFAIKGVLSQIQNEEEVVIAYASRSLRISQRRYCTTR